MLETPDQTLRLTRYQDGDLDGSDLLLNRKTLESTRVRSSHRSPDREPSPTYSKTELRVPPRSTTQSNSWEWAIAPANSLARVGQQAQTRLGQDLDTRCPVKNKPLEESLKPQHNDTD